MKAVGYHGAMAVVAAALLVMGAQFIPSSLLIQLRASGVDQELGVRTVVRTVTFETTADFKWEIENTATGVGVCSGSGRAPFEKRGLKPASFSLPKQCKPALRPGKYLYRYCVTAIGPFGQRLRPSCIVSLFANDDRAEVQQRALEEKVEALEQSIREISKWTTSSQ